MAIFKNKNQYPVVANNNSKPVFALDIGSRTIRLVSGLVDKDNFHVSITGFLDTPSVGVKNGTVADPELLAHTIADLIMNFQQTYGVEIKKIYTNVCGCYVKTETTEGKRNVQNDQITINDRNNTINDAISGLTDIHLNDYSIIHIIPQGYDTGVNSFLSNPVGIFAKQLKAKVHVIACNKTYIKNVDMTVRKISNTIESTTLVYDGTAASSMVLKESDRDLGCILVDIGASTITLTIFSEKYQRYSYGITGGADFITKKIAADFGIDMRTAEYIKIHYGQANHWWLVNDPSANDDVTKEIRAHDPSVPYISRLMLCSSICNSLKEMFLALYDLLYKQRLDLKLEAGFVLVGGGAQLIGISEFLIALNNEINKQTTYNTLRIASKARIGFPLGVNVYDNAYRDPNSLNAPCNAVALGILRAAVMDNPENFRMSDKGSNSGGSLISNVWNYVKREWN